MYEDLWWCLHIWPQYNVNKPYLCTFLHVLFTHLCHRVYFIPGNVYSSFLTGLSPPPEIYSWHLQALTWRSLYFMIDCSKFLFYVMISMFFDEKHGSSHCSQMLDYERPKKPELRRFSWMYLSVLYFDSC